MDSKFYIHASGEEAGIRTLDDNLNWSGSRVRALPKSVLDPSGQKGPWIWSSPYQECTSEFPEDELARFLRDNAPLRHQLTAHRAALREVAGVIVCSLEQGEQPRGYSISSELMQLLLEIDATLEIDIEPAIHI